MRLVLVLYAGFDSLGASSVMKLAHCARGKGHDVTVFAMSAGVMNLAREDFVSLLSSGVKITVCEHNLTQYMGPEGIGGVKYGSQYDLSGYVYDADKVVSFL
jgi:sulfur relay (sulfurtransferase) complex TusBCD TusD component (DsrE family)